MKINKKYCFAILLIDPQYHAFWLKPSVIITNKP